MKTQRTPTSEEIHRIEDCLDVMGGRPFQLCNCGEIEGVHIRTYGQKGKEFAWCEKMAVKTFNEIVRAVNAHDEMLDIIKRLNYAFYVHGNANALRPIMAETKALIARAEGKE